MNKNEVFAEKEKWNFENSGVVISAFDNEIKRVVAWGRKTGSSCMEKWGEKI